MASTINPNNINTLYPVAGQDNDTQGFRDNFRNIKNNLNAAAGEITSLQNSVARSPQIRYQGDIITNPVAAPLTSTAPGVKGQIAWGPDPDAPTYVYICISSEPTPKWVRANVSTW